MYKRYLKVIFEITFVVEETVCIQHVVNNCFRGCLIATLQFAIIHRDDHINLFIDKIG